MVLVNEKSNAKGTWTDEKFQSLTAYAVCINNADYPASLECYKIYRVLPDKDAAADGDLRITDKSGEDYLYSADRFVPIQLPSAVEKSFEITA